MAWLCYALLVAAWVVDLVTPQLFVAAILLNGPIALSSLTLRPRFTIGLIVAAEIANVVAGYVNGVQAGYHWDSIALGDRFLSAASFVLVGYLSIKTQEFAREAGASAGRMRQIEIEKALREATRRVRETLNLDLVRRAILRECVALLRASSAILIVRDSAFELPMLIEQRAGESDASLRRSALSTELATLAARSREHAGIVSVTRDDPLGRLTLDALGASEALAASFRSEAPGADYVLIALAGDGAEFSSDAPAALQAFVEQAAIALEQSRIFTQLGESNDQIERQRNELVRRTDIIRDIVYALAHDLRTPLAATEVTMKQALAGAYGALPDRYATVLRTTLAANEEERRMVETLLLVARYETGEESNVREPVSLERLLTEAVAEMRPLADASGTALQADVEGGLQVTGDFAELRRAVLNLVANAITATPATGSIVVRGRNEGEQVVIEVEDDGRGVPPDRVASLFERFGGSGPGSGTGLGLYIVRRIAEKHGGSATYAPRQSGGSTFRITLPKELPST